MTSPFEKLATQLDKDAILPVENWRQRRIDAINAHRPSILNIANAIENMRRLILDGRISTDLFAQTTVGDIGSTNPSEDISRADIGIKPTGVRSNWRAYGLWSPDFALGISISHTDSYEYVQGQRPRPMGRVALNFYARSWGKLSPKEQGTISQVEGAYSSFGDNGFGYSGSVVQIIRKAGQLLSQQEVETVLAPLAGHILGFFETKDIKDPGDLQPKGNFSDRNAHTFSSVSTEPRPTKTNPKPLELPYK